MNYLNSLVADAQKVTLFEGLSTDALADLLTQVNAFRRIYQKGEYIVHEGMKAETIYVIVSGHVLVTMAIDDGREHVARDLRSGSPIGLTLLYCDGVRGPTANWTHSVELPYWAGSVHAVEETVVIGFDVLQARRLSASGGPAFHPVFLNALYLLSDGLLNLWRKLIVLGGETTEDRVMAHLHRLKTENGGREEVVIPFSQVDWAGYMAVGRSSLCRALRNLKRRGKIAGRGRRFRLLAGSPKA